MSEYQYYEFQAIDRPLAEADRQALRALSTRARITATSFMNSYEWGDFRGDPDKLMERWFDLHLYLANWGSRRLMIRLPKRLVDQRPLDGFLAEVDCAKIRVAGENLILDIARDEVEFEDWDDGSGWLAALASLRADVLAGDLRLFYLLWLTAVEADAFEAGEPEPMTGIGPMTGALEAFVGFFGLDPDLVQAAAERPAEVRNRLGPETAAPPAAVRTVGELRARTRAIRLARERAEADKAAAEQKQQAEAVEKARRTRLDAIARRGESVWSEIETEIERRNAAGYDKATGLLFDLRAIAEERGTIEDFRRRLRTIRERHVRKERFIERLAAIG